MQDQAKSLEIVSEHATVEKRDVVTGKVRVSTVTETEQQMVSAVLNEDNVLVERIAVNKEISAIPDMRVEGDVTIIPVVEEVLVVEKRLLLREELHVRRSVSQRTVEEPISLRKQRAVIERDGGQTQSSEEANQK